VIRGLIPYEFGGTADQSPRSAQSPLQVGNTSQVVEEKNKATRFGTRARRGVRCGVESLLQWDGPARA